MQPSHILLNDALQSIREHGRLPIADWPAAHNAGELGLIEENGQLRWPTPPDLLQHSALQAAFPGVTVQVFDCIDSTSAHLISRDFPVVNKLCTAELQIGGRGRRGRSWVSPYARNLAMSMGFASTRQLPEMGGLSSVVGLGLLAGLEEAGASQVMLKWPNDVLVGNKKLCGILVDLLTRPGGTEFVAGIGVNVALTDEEILQIGQPVTDLRRSGVHNSRTELVITLLSRVQDFLQHFEEHGFAPFMEAFNRAHRYQLETCEIIQGEQRISGKVMGVGVHGELIMQTEAGEQRFHGGEVSLRPAGGDSG